MNKIASGIIILVIVVVLGSVIYLTRPPKSATEDIQTNTETLTPPENSKLNLTPYRISQEQSEVEFNIDEVLNGKPFTVVGKTSQVAGDILIDLGDLSLAEMGTIRINARTLKTDNINRDGAISRLILKSEKEEFEFIEFKPISITGLPANANNFQRSVVEITGELTIAGTTKTVTFGGIVDLISEDQISVLAQTKIFYKDFGLTIPEVPFVASVEDEVTLKAIINAFPVSEEGSE